MKCKVGDNAMIIKGAPFNLGKLVLIESAQGEVDYSVFGLGFLFCWNVKSLGGKLETRDGRYSMTGYIPDFALQPLPPDDGAEEEDEALCLLPVTVEVKNELPSDR